MATKSFLKTINIKNKKECTSLVHAMEYAQKKSAVVVKFNRSYHYADPSEIDKIFGDKK